MCDVLQASNPRADQVTKLQDIWKPAVTKALGSGHVQKIVCWNDVKNAVCKPLRPNWPCKASTSRLQTQHDCHSQAITAMGPEVQQRLPHGEWAAAVEMIILAQGGVFAGTWGSTFVSYSCTQP